MRSRNFGGQKLWERHFVILVIYEDIQLWGRFGPSVNSTSTTILYSIACMHIWTWFLFSLLLWKNLEWCLTRFMASHARLLFEDSSDRPFGGSIELWSWQLSFASPYAYHWVYLNRKSIGWTIHHLTSLQVISHLIFVSSRPIMHTLRKTVGAQILDIQLAGSLKCNATHRLTSGYSRIGKLVFRVQRLEIVVGDLLSRRLLVWCRFLWWRG